MSKPTEQGKVGAHTPVTFDGFGINGPDEYASRIATIQPQYREVYGPLIVKAVNCHQVLVEALRELFATVTVGRERFDNPYEPNTICYSAVEKARAALAQAEADQ